MSLAKDPVLHTFDLGLRAWLGFGLLAVLLLPAARGHAHWIGWLPYWLVAWPALALALLHRARWIVRRARPRQRRRRGAQARRQSVPPRRVLLAALRGH